MSEVIESGAVTAAEEQVAQVGAEQEMTQEGGVVTLSEILSDAQDIDAGNPEADGDTTPTETVVSQSDDGSGQAQDVTEPTSTPQPVYRTQADFDRAFAKRMANERARNRPYVEMGQTVMDVAGSELTSDEIRAAISHALAEKRSKAYNTDYDTEMNNIRVEQRVAQRSKASQPVQDARQGAENPDVRAREMVSTMNAIGDDRFSVEALQGNHDALVAWANGATPAEVYEKYFAGAAEPVSQKPAPTVTKPKRPAPERTANSGAMGRQSPRLTRTDIEKIDAAIAAGRDVSLI